MVLALLVLAGALLVWHPDPVLRAVLRLASQEVRFDDLRIGLNELELRGVEFGEPPAQELRQLRIRYRPRMLLGGRIEEVEARGLTLHGSLDQDGLRLRGLEGASAGQDEGRLLPLPLPERIAIRDARLELSTPIGALSVPFAAELRPGPGGAAFALDVEQARLAGATGRVLADLHLEGEAPFDPERPSGDLRGIVAGLTARGRADLGAESLSLAGLAEGIDGRAELAVGWERGRLDASLSELRLKLAALAPEWPALAEVLPAPWLLELERPAGIAASFLADETLIEGRGSVALSSAGGHLGVAASTALTLGPDGGLRELVVSDGDVVLRDAVFAGMRLDRGTIRLDGAGTARRWAGELALELAGDGEPAAGLRLEGLSAEAGLDARFADGRLSLLVRDPGAVRLERLSFGEAGQISDLELRLPAGEAPLLSADFRDGGIAWRQRLAAQVPTFEATALADGAPLRLEGEIQQLAVELAGEGAGLGTGQITVTGGAAHVPAHGLRLADIEVAVALSADGLAPGQTIPIAVGSIAHEGEPAWFAPLRLEGSMQPQGDRIAFDAVAARKAGGFEARVAGEHDLASGQGQARLELAPIDFAPGQLQPAGVSPLVGGFASDVAGRLAMDGGLRWGAGGIDADLELLVEDLAFTSGPARFEEVNGVIALDRLLPPSTPPGQQLAVGLIDIGLPLTNGLLTFDLEPQHLAVEQLRWQFAEGRIQAAPFTIGSADMRFSTILTAERLQLDEIFALTQLDGLSGEGMMHGTLPITVAGADAVIEGGELVSDRPGWVRYRPAQAPAALQAGGENINLLLQALENFRYEKLRLTVDGRTDAEMDVGLHIAGANPDLYDGYPIEFNLNLEGALANVLRSGLAGYQIPERIRERMQGFGR
jgi:Dicarboxylate transport